MSEELTSVDIKILEQMQQDASLSTIELAERVGLSQSPCWRRLQRLRDEGYIASEVALLNRRKFGDSFIAFATLKMATLTEGERADFQRKVAAIPEIMECYTTFGERDVIMKIIVSQSLEWYQRFVFNVVLKLPGVQDVQSVVALSEIKHTTAIPVRGTRAL